MARYSAKRLTHTSPASPLQIYVPRPPLSALIASFWYSRGNDSPHAKELVLPAGSADVVIRLDAHQAIDGGVFGPRSRPVVVGSATTCELLGVHFAPGGAYPFLKFSLGDILNRGVTLQEIFGSRDSRQLLDALSEARDVDDKFRVLQNWLMRLAQQALAHHPAVAFALDASIRKPAWSSLELAKHAGYSQRRFIEVFRNEVGMRPKLFCRLQRFRSVVRRLRDQSAVDWTNLALASGFFDQSHFIHDFREFSSVTPQEYLGLRTSQPNHLRHPG